MTQHEASEHWLQGARDALEMAKLGHRNEKYALSLFHCHLAVEKALKGKLIEKAIVEAPPPTHDLVSLALKLRTALSDDDKTMLSHLTDYSVAARYDDPEWAKCEATAKNCNRWINHVERFFSLLNI